MRRTSASASRPARPARSISGRRGPRCSTTSSRGTTAARSSSGSRTRTSPGAPSRTRRTSSRGSTGSGSRWDEGPDVAGRGGTRSVRAVPPDAAARRSTRAAADAPAARPTSPIPATARPRSSTPTGRRQEAAHQPPRYVGRCANLTPEERAAREAEGRSRRSRFRVGEGVVAFDDLVRGASRSTRRTSAATS